MLPLLLYSHNNEYYEICIKKKPNIFFSELIWVRWFPRIEIFCELNFIVFSSKLYWYLLFAFSCSYSVGCSSETLAWKIGNEITMIKCWNSAHLSYSSSSLTYLCSWCRIHSKWIDLEILCRFCKNNEIMEQT